MADEVQGVLVEHVVPGFVREPEAADLLQGLVHIHERIGAGKDEAVGKAVIGGFDIKLATRFVDGRGKVQVDVAVPQADGDGLAGPGIAAVADQDRRSGKSVATLSRAAGDVGLSRTPGMWGDRPAVTRSGRSWSQHRAYSG